MKNTLAHQAPFQFPNGGLVKNRLVMAPMTTSAGFYDGSVSDDLVEYYKARAGTIGTIIVECCFVDNLGPAFPGALAIDNDRMIPGLARIARAIKSKGSKAILQIYHGGRMVEPELIGGKTPIAPSAVAAPREGAVIPREMSAEEVDMMITKFGDAVSRAMKAGYDGVEIHGANTYLIQQFFSPHSNRRNDKWGGSRENRANFPLEILKITQKMAQYYEKHNFIIGYRFSPEEIEEPGIRFEDTLYLLDKLAEQGLDYVHFSMGHYLRNSLINKEDATPLITRYIKERSETLAKIPVIGVGSVVNLGEVNEALAHGYDLIAAGKACIVYPDWADKLAEEVKLELTMESGQRIALKVPEPLWRFSLVDALIREAEPTVKHYKMGVFEEKVELEAQKLKISVELSTDRITDVMMEIDDTLDIDFTETFEEIRNRILVANSPWVDAVAGATAQSEALKKAVSRAMTQSTKEHILATGGNLNELQHFDVVVIGSGGAGLAAAIQAHDDGAKVLIIEKMPTIGGNTIKASVGMNAAESIFQKIKGIKDDRTLFYQETLKGGKFINNQKLLHSFIQDTPIAIDWLADKGIELSDITITGGMSIDRTHRPADRSAVGGYLISGLLKNVVSRGIEVMLDTEVVDISYENDTPSAVKIKDDKGEISTLKAKSVVVATGGFSANAKMVEQYKPELKGFVTTNHPGATGCGIKLLTEIGADTIDLEQIQIHPTVEQKTSYLISESIRGGGAILVNHFGHRFCNEMDTRDHVSQCIISLPQKNAWIIFDDQVRLNNKASEEYIEQGLAIVADSLIDLAHKINIEESALEQTLKRYNQWVSKGKDEEFGRETALRYQLEQAPFYAILIAPGIHHTMGGVVINQEGSVLDKTRYPIRGVFAAGEVTGGVHGANRIGGNAIADIIVFGIRAGSQAAHYAQNKR
ncbi:flavocytochrome c [Thorsellia kenyensis]|uniref:Flavocytochrome c n=1 Tax=Thorsellia kenyensis TaxID=1549888 RepID=A0ABV6CB26_9GAMM